MLVGNVKELMKKKSPTEVRDLSNTGSRLYYSAQQLYLFLRLGLLRGQPTILQLVLDRPFVDNEKLTVPLIY